MELQHGHSFKLTWDIGIPHPEPQSPRAKGALKGVVAGVGMGKGEGVEWPVCEKSGETQDKR